MDYTKKKFGFKIKKTLRYIKLYGISRTVVKIRGQYHMKKIYENFPKISEIPTSKYIALIGCGNYSFSNLAYYLKKNFGNVIGAVMDVDINRAASLSERYKVPFYTNDAKEIMNQRSIRLVYIASNHSTHAEYAIEAMKNGKDVYIEKPHVVNEDQLLRLHKTMKTTGQKVFLGFNRPGSVIGSMIQGYLKEQKGIGVYNWFVAGHEIDPSHWYFRKEEGGRILGNVCHWTDFLFQLIPKEDIFPITINPTRSKSSDSNVVISYKFGDGSIAVISFSAMGHTFEGVREKFNCHKGNCLITMSDFQDLRIDINDEVVKKMLVVRDHGHECNIVSSCKAANGQLPYNRKKNEFRIINSAWLFLKTKEALDDNKILFVESFY